MPSREEMIAALKAADGAPKKKPTRAEMIATLKANEAPTHFGLKPKPDMFEQHDLLGEGLEYAGRALDWPGGLLRTAIAGGAEALSGKDVVQKGDVMRALKGQAPGTADYAARMGVPEGPRINLSPLEGDTSVRDIGGFVGDVVADPLSLGSKAIKALRPTGEVLSQAGKSMYKSGLKNVDKIVVEKGKSPVSDILLNERKTGSVEKLAKDASDINKKLLDERAKLYQQASDAGAVVDMTSAVSGARQKLAKLRENPGMREVADKLEAFLNKYEGEGFVDIQSVSDWKTALYDSLPQNAFGPNGKVKGPVKAFEKVLSRDFKGAIEKAADEVAPGLGKKISVANDKMATLITAKKPFATEIKKAVTPNYVTVMDAMGPGGLGILTGTHTGDPVTGLLAAGGALALKKGAEASRTAGFRTRGGLLLKDVGDLGLTDDAGRRVLINRYKKKDEQRR